MRTTRRGLLAAPLLVLAGCGKDDRARLQGDWRVAAAEWNGAPSPEILSHVLTVSGEGFRIAAAGRVVHAGSFTLHPDPRPAWIDMRVIDNGALRAAWLGIYRFTAEGLEIADNAPDTKQPRPRDFAARHGVALVRFVKA